MRFMVKVYNASVNEFVTAAQEAIARSLTIPQTDRRGAFALLEADAYLTYACQMAMEAGADDAALEDLLARFVEGAV